MLETNGSNTLKAGLCMENNKFVKGQVLIKAIEEMSELTQVLAKMEYVGGTDYWHGRDLRPELIEELGDVRAILNRLFSRLDDDTKASVMERQFMKSRLYGEWWD